MVNPKQNILSLPILISLLLLPLPPSSAQSPFDSSVPNADPYVNPLQPIIIPLPNFDPNPNPVPIPDPPQYPRPAPTFRKQVREFVSEHNVVRSRYNLAPVSWDRKIARCARRWSDSRRGDCELIHSGSPDYGENMFWGSGNDWTAGDAIRTWADESEFYNLESNTCEVGKMCGHFTQIVWNTTIRIGCGRSECTNGGVIITCNYFPPGNYAGERPF